MNDLKRDKTESPFSVKNVRMFVLFRIFFNARFYYPVFTVLFLDYGLSLEEFAILNVAWAVSIVLLEIPSGALADTIGRVKLVRFASCMMLVEMVLIGFAPIGSSWVFWVFLINRILSGAAEAAASGADEALAYDSLKDACLESQWDRVLEVLMRWKSFAFVIAMSVGAAVYDHDFLNGMIQSLGLSIQLSQEITIRIPIFMTLLLSLGAIYTSFSMNELLEHKEAGKIGSAMDRTKAAFLKTMSAGHWILQTPLAISIILAGVLFDHTIRLILTINSEYMRLIDLPEASFGAIAAVISAIGIFTPRFSRYLVGRLSEKGNYLLLAIFTAIGLGGMSLFYPYLGVFPMALLSITIGMASYFVSYYLNKITDSKHRATVLSFKGLSFNLAYGVIGLLYSWLVAQLRMQTGDSVWVDEDLIGDHLFMDSFQWILPYFLLLFFACSFFIGIRNFKRNSAP
jgi:MFS family permease